MYKSQTVKLTVAMDLYNLRKLISNIDIYKSINRRSADVNSSMLLNPPL
jgi:hypothetical protein